MNAVEVAIATRKNVGIEVTAGDPKDQPRADEINAALDKYLSEFAAPVIGEGDGFAFGRGRCLKCGESLGGMFGTFQWGIAHGEGCCSKCGWPARAIHYPKDASDKPIFTRGFQAILQYHPSVVQTKDTEDDE